MNTYVYSKYYEPPIYQKSQLFRYLKSMTFKGAFNYVNDSAGKRGDNITLDTQTCSW